MPGNEKSLFASGEEDDVANECRRGEIYVEVDGQSRWVIGQLRPPRRSPFPEVLHTGDAVFAAHTIPQHGGTSGPPLPQLHPSRQTTPYPTPHFV